MHHITASPGDSGKSLLTVVNPVQKPPRRYDQDNGSMTAEMTELNRKLLDDSESCCTTLYSSLVHLG